MTITIQSVINDSKTFSERLLKELPSQSQIPPAKLESFRALRRYVEQLASEIRKLDVRKEQAAKLYERFKMLNGELEEGLVQIQARYTGDPLLKPLGDAIRGILNIYSELLIDLRVLLDAYEGSAPARIRTTLGPHWEKLLDHILLYHELKAREKEAGQKISLDELAAKHGL